MTSGEANPQQRQAIEHLVGPGLVIAGAGTGKTRVITDRIINLVQNHKVEPGKIVALTFTDKAAREMEERVDRVLPYGQTDTRIMTFHSFGEQLLKQYGHDLGLSINLKLMTKAQQIVFLRENIDQLKLKYYAPAGDPGSYLTSLSAYFSRLADELIKPEQYRRYIKKLPQTNEQEQAELERHSELLGAYETYIKLKRKQGLIDYDDQVGLAVELFELRPNVLKAVRGQIDYLMVDEFQDTNRAQNRLLALLAGSGGNIMAVGDDDQSIYRFRGAAVENILEFDRQFPKAKQVVLTKNYRSTQQILDAAYRLIQHNNPDRLESRQQISKYLQSSTSGPEPQVWVLPTYSLEATAIAEDIKRRLNDGQDPSEVAILLRKKNQADAVRYALGQQAVVHHFDDATSLYDLPEVATLEYFLQSVTNPDNSTALYHLLSAEPFHLSLTFLSGQAATARRRNLNLETQLGQEVERGDGAPKELQVHLEQLDTWRQRSKELTAGQLLFAFMDDSGLIKNLVQRSYDDPVAAVQIQNINKFFSIVGEFERVSRDRSALALATSLEDLRDAGEEPDAVAAEPSPDEVRIMTIHKSKGLEFELVYLFDMVKGAFPGPNRRQAIELPPELAGLEDRDSAIINLQEERRLMYVAMTRAKRELIMTFSPDHGGKLLKKPSPFLQEATGLEAPTLEPATGADQSIKELQQFRAPAARQVKKGSNDKLILTPHQIDDYLSCPANFHYRHVLMVPEPPAPALMYGSLIHEAINRYYDQKQQGRVDQAALLNLVNEMWRSDGFISKGQEEVRRAQAQETIKSFIKRESASKQLPRYTERSFEVSLEKLGVVIRGRMDAVFETDGQIEIRDYKTSAVNDQKKADTKAKGSVQLAVYALAWKELSGQLPQKLTLDYVETGLTGSYSPTIKDLEKVQSQVKQVADGIRAGEFTPSGNCFYCSHPKVVRNDA